MSVPGAESWVITSFDYDVTNPNANAAPEPATWALLAVGFAALGYAGLRRRRDVDAGAA
jgi:hypothetical protein